MPPSVSGSVAGAPRAIGLPAGPRLSAAGSALRGQHRGRRGDPGQRQHRLLAGQTQRLLRRRLARLDLEGETDVAAFDDDARDHLERDHVLAALGVDHAGERIENLLLGNLRHG